MLLRAAIKHGFSMPYFELRPRDDYPINTPRAIAL
jgi:hypothetical protein